VVLELVALVEPGVEGFALRVVPVLVDPAQGGVTDDGDGILRLDEPVDLERKAGELRPL
jgi:hypothetical protein